MPGCGPDPTSQPMRLPPNADLHAFARCGDRTQTERAAGFNELPRAFLRA